ncbi:MAG TPA: rhomboid family intramembrane serine protease [Verrucomicrobiae bacterium]|nr:rhomboid family intramembrane serine protease [Verrucomicrobiae bacterium]
MPEAAAALTVRRVSDEPRDPLPPAGEPGIDVDEAGYVPPDPEEPPPVELGRVGDVLPWSTSSVLLAWALVFFWFASRAQMELSPAYLAWGANVDGRPPLETAWRLLASTFLHAGAAHVGMNAVSLLLFGSSVEAVFSRWAFWIVYAFGGAAASAGSLAWHAWRHPGTMRMSVGGSGAIFALGGALLASAIRLRGRLAVGRARALAAGALFLLTQSLVAGFSHLGTDNAAHASGLIAGFAIGAMLPVSEQLGGGRTSAVVAVTGGLAAAAALVAFALAVASGVRAGY